jgi:CheY-like chemotaxis protein
VSIAFAPFRPAQHGLSAERCSSTKGPALLVIGDHLLCRLAMCLIVSHSHSRARAFHCAPADAVDVARAAAIDLILLNVDASLMESFVLAAHLRAADRGRTGGRSTAIVAFSSSNCKLQDCLVGGRPLMER